MATEYWLSPHVVACTTEVALIFLDLLHDRYHGVPLMSSCKSDHSGAPLERVDDSYVPANVLEQLQRIDLLRREPSQRTFTQQRLATLQQDDWSTPTRTRMRDVTTFLRACGWSRRALRIRSLLSIASELSASPWDNSVAHDVDQTRRCAAAFRALRPIAFAAQDRCLFHALALSRFATIHKLRPVWVIGVRTQPWSAHSWVQCGSVLMDATPEQIRPYSVILAV